MQRARIALFIIGVTLMAGGCGQEVTHFEFGTPPQTCSTGGTAVAFRESARMEPGNDCVGCHARIGEAPDFLLAGTVMASLRDDTNCVGVEGVTVRLTGADGNTIELLTNASGNFYSSVYGPALVFPFHAEITRNGVTARMLSARTSGETSCNRCHTAAGANGAPGRILAP